MILSFVSSFIDYFPVHLPTSHVAWLMNSWNNNWCNCQPTLILVWKFMEVGNKKATRCGYCLNAVIYLTLDLKPKILMSKSQIKWNLKGKHWGIVLLDTNHWLLFCLPAHVLEKLWGKRLATCVRNPTTLWIMNTVHDTPPSNIPAKFKCLRRCSRCLKQENQWIPKANGISKESHNQDQMTTYLWMLTGSLMTAKGLRKFHLFSTGEISPKRES
jgi:hypothetical protein